MSSNEKKVGIEEKTEKEKKSHKKRSRSRERDSKKKKRSRSRSSKGREKKLRKRSRSRSKSNKPDTTKPKKRESRWSSVPPSDLVISNNPSVNQNIILANPINIPIVIPTPEATIHTASSDLLSISEKLKQINPLLGLTAPNTQPFTPVVNPNIIHTLNDSSKIKKKIFIPKMEGVNFVGLLLGPKGCYQKRLEQQSGCKILIRGR